jgi:hypothetical protein
MKDKKDYRKQRKEESQILLRIPEGPVPRPQGGSLEVRDGAGHHNYQYYAGYCLNEQGGEPTLEAFKAKFTAWSLEDVGSGIVLYPEGPAFKVLSRHFMEGTEPVTYYAEAAHYMALMLCLHPTVYAPGASGDEQLASYEVFASWEPGGPVDHAFVEQRPIESTGEIFMLKLNYYSQKVSLKIRIFPSPAGRNNIFLGGRLGALLSESI